MTNPENSAPAAKANGNSATTAAEQLRRLLLALPALADDRAHPVSEIAQRVGTSDEVIRRDLTTLVNRVGAEPGGFTEGVSLLIASDTVQFLAPSGHFRRPMALTRTELQSLDLGLAMLSQESPPDERAVIARARERVRLAAASIPAGDPATESDRAATLGREVASEIEQRRAIQDCIRSRRVATIKYQSASSTAVDERRVQSLGVVWARGAWYLVAWCERNDGLRVFRCDRILDVHREETRFTPPDGFSLESVLREGKVLSGNDATQMRVRYSPRIARWIAEREHVAEEEDGSLAMDVPVFDEAWAVRRVLRYGPDAVVESPESIRALIRAQLEMLVAMESGSAS